MMRPESTDDDAQACGGIFPQGIPIAVVNRVPVKEKQTGTEVVFSLRGMHEGIG
ncbi:MAG: hypothetical protein JRF33_14415 [Deltaproteobacteria bacterium]|nr:hypothetical protein [Deltaproteobacteria bacterium]